MNSFWFSTIKASVSLFQSVLMGCFISCFRSRNREGKFRSRPRARSYSNSYYELENVEGRLAVDNQLGSLFLNGENDTEDACDHPHTLDEELRREAKHLKLCGVILETPQEICKSNNRIALRELNGANQSPNSAHALSNKRIQLFAQCEEEINPDQTIIGAPGPVKETAISRQNTPGTGSGDEMIGNKLNLTPVRCGIGSWTPDPSSPHPTPLNVNDDMKTPATVYSSYSETSITGKRRARIQAQYAYPALESTQNKEVSTNINSSELEKENELAVEFSFTTSSFGETKKSSKETPKVLVPNISEWLIPTTTFRGRNGIPNRTTKSTEDQQITWHKTPFEERLERGLTDEELSPSRKLTSGRLIELEG